MKGACWLCGSLRVATWLLAWQVGENRIASLGTADRSTAAEGDAEEEATPPVLIVRDDSAFRHETLWRGAAVALPVFSLRSRDSVGAGEFEDIRKLVDLCHTAGARGPCLRVFWKLLNHEWKKASTVGSPWTSSLLLHGQHCNQ